MSCLGCEQERMVKERSFDLIKSEAQEYAKKNQLSVVIFMEGQVWKYISTEIAFRLGIPFREIVHHNQPVDAGQVHQMPV